MIPVNSPRSKSRAKSARRQKKVLAKNTAKLDTQKVGKLFIDLVNVQARLRAPGGCPWDREQTHETLRTYLIEETYEVLDAIESGSKEELTEELGDLLLQVLFHADLAREANKFDLSDVIVGIHDKMIRRHPHVFGNVKAETSGEVLKNWAQIKAQEKQQLQDGADATTPSVLDGVPRSLPALLEAFQISRRAAKIGFDWEEVDGIFEKINEEVVELKKALAPLDRYAVEEELGDILFTVVNLSRFLGLDPEVTLKKSNQKFKQRFIQMENEASTQTIDLSKLSKGELEELWRAAKRKAKPEVSSGYEA
ncbi:MAG TPA: nucleoside triphosphate pyrophosphohydrolase [Candidatus Acidoferrales bacterium]|jgi:MazG family protein|nr:nucleoside triphosphate pyrophosphohydrolase [Candidatus Acidoferrales bacterium]